MNKTITIYTTYTITTTIYIPSTTTITYTTLRIDTYVALLISITLFIIGLAILYAIRISRR